MLPVLFQLGPITLHTYGLMVALGFLTGLHVARGQFERFNLPANQVDRIVFYLMIFGLLGARILFFAVDDFAELRVDPTSFFRIWEGGLVFYGGVLADMIMLWIYSRSHVLPYLSLTDAFAPSLLLGHAFGRLGCFAAGCCYGKPTTLPWGVIFKNPATLAPRFVPLHPTQLYEFAGNLALFWAALVLSRRTTKTGELTGFYCVSYGVFRFAIEMLRGDDRGITHFGLSPSQGVALGLIAIGITVLFNAKKDKNI